MTVNSATNKVIGLGDGSATAWPFSFKVYSSAHISVIVTDGDGVETTLDSSAYTLTLNSNQDTAPGGTVTYPLTGAALASDRTLTIRRVVPYTQTSDLKNQGGFFPEVHERALDVRAMAEAQLGEEIGRTLRVGASQASVAALADTAAERAGRYLSFNAAGNPTVTDISSVVASAVASYVSPLLADIAVGMAGALQVFNATDYGVVANGTTDDTAALQLAATACMASGRSSMFVLPPGTMKTTSPVVFANPGTTGVQMPFVVGAGQSLTVIDARLASDGPALDFRGIPANGSTSPASTKFGFGGGLSGFTVSGANATAANVDGIRMRGWWNARHATVKVTNVSRHCVTAPYDAAWDANPDWSACTNHEWFGCIFQRSGGYGFHNPDTQGCPGMAFAYTVAQLCYLGGFYVSSDGWYWMGCSFSGCGWESESDAITSRRAYGIEYHRGNRGLCIGGEFDNNFTAHVGIASASQCRFIENRFIHNNRYTGTILRPPVGVEIGIDNNSDQAIGNVFDGNNTRVDPGDNAISTNTLTMYLYSNVSSGNVSGTRVVQKLLTNSGGATITGQSGFDTSGNNYNYDNDIRVHTGPSVVKAMAPAGALPFVDTEIVAGVSFSNASFGVQPFAATGPSSSANFPWNSAYSASTRKFTAPFAGWYEVRFDWTIDSTSTVAGDQTQIRLTKNGSGGAKDWYFTQVASTTRQSMCGEWRISLAAGDTLEMQSQAPRASMTFFAARTTFKMVT